LNLEFLKQFIKPYSLNKLFLF